MTDLLDDTELARWQAWKQATDAVWAHVVQEITAATGLSSADFSVLTRVVEADGPVRQQELADQLRWQRSRLSRQLVRMAERGLVERTGSSAAREVRPTGPGVEVAAEARVAHARAVRAALLDRVGDPAEVPFWEAVGSLSRPA